MEEGTQNKLIHISVLRLSYFRRYVFVETGQTGNPGKPGIPWILGEKD